MCRHDSHSFLNATLEIATCLFFESVAQDGVHLHCALPCWSCGSLSSKENIWIVEHLEDTISCCTRMRSLNAFLSNESFPSFLDFF